MLEEYAAGEAEVHLEPQTKTTLVAKPKRQEEEQNSAQKGRKQKRAEQSRAEQAEESEYEKAFISDEAYSFWEKNLSDKGFIRERGSIHSSHPLQR